MKKTITKTQMILTALYVVALLTANTVSVKQFLLPFGITMTGAIFAFPITYIISDIFSEVYGYKYSRFSCYLAFAMNIFMVVIYELAIITPAPSYWTMQEAFSSVLGNAPRILFASLTAYVVGDFANDKVFQKMKERSKENKGFTARAILSSLVGETMDSLIFIPLAFLGTMPVKSLLIMGVTQVSIKVLYEIIIMPITNIVVKRVKQHEEK